MKYRVVSIVEDGMYSISFGRLADQVEALCKDGWKPQGGVSISAINYGPSHKVIVAQAMIKEEDVTAKQATPEINIW